MHTSWLVQRLQTPINGPSLLGDNPFSFGGGLRNGGLSGDAMQLLRPIFRFDYMGAAEFEFGAVPEALQEIARLASKEQLTADILTIPLRSVKRHWRTPKDAALPVGDGRVFILCNRSDVNEVKSRIKEWATGTERLKEMTRLSSALLPVDKWDSNTAGWLELDNGFMFFTDSAMWERTAALFGVEAAVPA